MTPRMDQAADGVWLVTGTDNNWVLVADGDEVMRRGQAPGAGRANGWWPGNLVGWLAGQWQGGQDLASDRSCLGDFG